MMALHSAVQMGKALYVGISNYDAEQSLRAIEILEELGTPCLIHQPKYNMLLRSRCENGLFEVLEEKGECVHHIAFEVKGMDEHIEIIEKKGMPLTQRGRWTEGSRGSYAYFDSGEELGLILELLENY